MGWVGFVLMSGNSRNPWVLRWSLILSVIIAARPLSLSHEREPVRTLSTLALRNSLVLGWPIRSRVGRFGRNESEDSVRLV